jgi:hypothetical protein
VRLVVADEGELDELVELPSGEIKNVNELTPSEGEAFCTWLLEKAERANRHQDRLDAGDVALCDYWDVSSQKFCDAAAAVLVSCNPAFLGVSDPPSALCERHRILAL